MNEKFKTIISVSIVVALASGVMSYLNNMIDRTFSDIDMQVSVSENYKTYRNTDLGFEFKYPSSWSKTDCMTGSEGGCLFTLNAGKISDSTLPVEVTIFATSTTKNYNQYSEVERIRNIIAKNYVTPEGAFGVETCYRCESDRYTVGTFYGSGIDLNYYTYTGKYSVLERNYFIATEENKTIRINIEGEDGPSASISYPNKLDNNKFEIDLNKLLMSIKLTSPDFSYTLGESYVDFRESVAKNGWLPIIPEKYELGSGMSTTTPIDERFPEISSCGSGVDMVCSVSFINGKYRRGLMIQPPRTNRRTSDWTVAGRP